MLEQQIDKFIEINKDGYQKYILKCSVKYFKQLQDLMQNKYKIKDYLGTESMWTHIGVHKHGPVRFGTVKFKNFEINVYCPTRMSEGYQFGFDDDFIDIDLSLFKHSKK